MRQNMMNCCSYKYSKNKLYRSAFNNAIITISIQSHALPTKQSSYWKLSTVSTENSALACQWNQIFHLTVQCAVLSQSAETVMHRSSDTHNKSWSATNNLRTGWEVNYKMLQTGDQEEPSNWPSKFVTCQRYQTNMLFYIISIIYSKETKKFHYK